jgi:hypothetical protein
VHDLPPNALNPDAPAGTAPAAAAHPGSFWCAHGFEWTWQAEQGGFLPMIITADEMHPGDVPIPGQGALPGRCQPASGLNPAKYPNKGPAAVARARREVLLEHARQRRERREQAG